MNAQRLTALSLTLLAGVTLAACNSVTNDIPGSADSPTGTGGTTGGDNTGGAGGSSAGNGNKACTTDTQGVTTCQIDASGYDHYVYYRFGDDNPSTLSDAQSRSSANWDIAFRRYAVKTNGGVSSDGPGKAGAALLAAQDSFYNADDSPDKTQFTNATPASQRAVFTGPLPAPGSWIRDQQTSALQPPPANDTSNCNVAVSPPNYRINYGWYTYNGGCVQPSEHGPHSLYANPDVGWLLRSAAGDSFARLRATQVSFATSTGLTATFALRVQPANTSAFSIDRSWQITSMVNGQRCYDFDTGTSGDCSSNDWDLKLTVDGRDLALYSNSGPSGPGLGAAFGPRPWSEILTYDNGTVGPAGEPLAELYVPDANSSIMDLQTWYAYDVNGQHLLWPNYRVYAVSRNPDDDAGQRFALQLLNYYSNSGTSGHITFRYRSLAP